MDAVEAHHRKLEAARTSESGCQSVMSALESAWERLEGMSGQDPRKRQAELQKQETEYVSSSLKMLEGAFAHNVKAVLCVWTAGGGGGLFSAVLPRYLIEMKLL